MLESDREVFWCLRDDLRDFELWLLAFGEWVACITVFEEFLLAIAACDKDSSKEISGII